MTSSKKRNDDPVLVRTRQALRRLRDEVARELDIDPTKIQDGYWGNLSAREAGAIGGRMVKRMIEAAERALAGETEADERGGLVRPPKEPERSSGEKVSHRPTSGQRI
ncbi:MAG: alpha/beta-type small acid-soluble spore protein [Firmicutes bacterium]|nr:alpha/beta-type small acid-soluble spore protein [Bacillota bacterium]